MTDSSPLKPCNEQLAEGPGWTALSGREDLAKYGRSNSIILFAAELYLNVEDIDSFAAEALTDHNNDKKCDLVSVNVEQGIIVVGQTYAAQVPNNKTEAPSAKTSDLNAAVSWLLTGDTDTLPEVLRGAAEQARQALKDGSITDFQIWSVHNCPESKNIQCELKQVESTAHDILKRNFPSCSVNVSSREIGKSRINSVYTKNSKSIVVTDPINIPIDGGFAVDGNTWSSYNTTIPLSILRDLWSKHATDLLSPNVRDYLGIRRSEQNINFGIKRTAISEADDFFIFNNGITAMVDDFTVSDDHTMLTINGLGIVNGGQTTGAIGTLTDSEAPDLPRAKVLLRIVKTKTPEIMQSVVRFNNTQNRVESADFRSTDAVQESLRIQFSSVPQAHYRGGRRGGESNAIRRDRDLLADKTVAQALAAFHGEPNIGYNETSRIWEEDATYARFFNEETSARHIVFCYALLKAIDAHKRDVSSIPEAKRTKIQSASARFFSSRGSSVLLVAAIADSIESVLGKAVPDLFRLRFIRNVSPYTAIGYWRGVIDPLSSFCTKLSVATNQGLKSKSKVDSAVETFSMMIDAVKDSLQTDFENFSKMVETA